VAGARTGNLVATPLFKFIWQTRPQVECGAPNLALGFILILLVPDIKRWFCYCSPSTA